MTERILELSEQPVRVSLRGKLLVLKPEGGAEQTIPLRELAVLVAGHPQVQFSHPTLAALAEAGAMVVVCGANHHPVGMLMPLEGHSTQVERFAAQARAGPPLKKRLWRQIVIAKIKAQARALADIHGETKGLEALAGRVRSGDSGNCEGQAARRYWPLLFADAEFRREREGEDQNRMLNYGYAVLRATVARAVCASGLHPTLGLHHHNRYNAFCLVDDLMEPLRPLVDRQVVEVMREKGGGAEMDREVKTMLLDGILGRVRLQGESRTLFDALARMSASLGAVFEGKRKTLLIPEV